MLNYPKELRGGSPFGVRNKILLHYQNVYDYLEHGDCAPISCEVNLTDKCLLNCQWCISDNVKVGNTIPGQLAMKFVNGFKTSGGKSIIFTGGGEPTCHPDFIDILGYARDLGLDIALLTNGVYPDSYNKDIGEKCLIVRVSLDTLNWAKYQHWKGVDKVGHVLENILDLAQYPTKIWINVNVCPEHTVEDIKALIKDFPKGAYGLQFRPVMPRFFLKEKFMGNPEVEKFLFEEMEEYFRLLYGNTKPFEITTSREKWESYRTGPFDFKYCEGHYITPAFNSNGDVAVCLYHLTDPRFTFGNILKQTFEEIWNSEKRKHAIMFARSINYSEVCQACCRLCETNRLFCQLKWDEQPEDKNIV